MLYNLNNLRVSLNDTEKDTSCWVILDGNSAYVTVLDWYGFKKKNNLKFWLKWAKLVGYE